MLKTFKTEVSKQIGTERRESGRSELPEIRAWVPPSLRPQNGLSEEAQRDEIFRKVSCNLSYFFCCSNYGQFYCGKSTEIDLKIDFSDISLIDKRKINFG